MHRVELKGSIIFTMAGVVSSFLMHRVELKGEFQVYRLQIHNWVPNAPCGVERTKTSGSFHNVY